MEFVDKYATNCAFQSLQSIIIVQFIVMSRRTSEHTCATTKYSIAKQPSAINIYFLLIQNEYNKQTNKHSMCDSQIYSFECIKLIGTAVC